MNSTCRSWILFTVIGLSVWGVPPERAGAQSSQEIGAALEQPGLTWESTEWSVASQVQSRADVMTATAPPKGEPPVLRTQVNGPAKLVFDWTVAAGPSVESLGLSVNGCELRLLTYNLQWRCVELQLPAGAHTIEWRPCNEATVYLDNVIHDAGQTLGFVLGLNDGESGVWAVHTGTFAQAPATARDGQTSTARLLPDEQGRAEAWRMLPGSREESLLVSWWQRQVPNGEGLSGIPWLSVMGSFSSNYSTWETRERVAAAGQWIKVEGFLLPGAEQPGALYLDDFAAQPLTLPRALETSGLPWTGSSPDGVLWHVSGQGAPGASEGQAEAHSDGPFESTLTTTLQGPALFTVAWRDWSAGVDDTGDLLPVLNGTALAPHSTPQGVWGRLAVPLPPGESTLALTARETGESGGTFGLDQANLLVPADAALGDALVSGGPPPPLWVSQAGGVTRDGENPRTGTDPVVRLNPSNGQVCEMALDLSGPSLLSFWMKSDPGAQLILYSAASWGNNVAAHGGGTWELRTLEVPAGSQRVHLVATGAAVWLDALISVEAVPLVEALDLTTDIPTLAGLPGAETTGTYAAQLPAGSGAVDGDALIFAPSGGSSLAVPFTAVPARVRFRHLTNGTLTLRLNGQPSRTVFSAFSGSQGEWREADVILPELAASESLEFFGNSAWLDHLRIESLTRQPWDAAGIPVTGAPAGWAAYDKAGRAGGIGAVSLSSAIAGDIPLTPLITGPCDLSAWWRRGRSEGPDFRFYCAADSMELRSMEWEPLHVHMDQPTGVSFSIAATNWDRARGAEGLVDGLTITPRPALSFSQALDTDAPGAGLLAPGWTAMGSATAAVAARVSFDGTDAIVVRPDPAFSGAQRTTLRARFERDGFFRLRARRSGSGAACTVRWSPNGGGSGWRDIPLTSDWFLLRECAPIGGFTAISIEVDVDGSDPASAVYLDTFAWEVTPATGALLEAAAFSNWTISPANSWTAACRTTRAGASATGMESPPLSEGAAASISASVTGPGYVVFSTGNRSTGGWSRLDASVDGVVLLTRRRHSQYGDDEWTDQVFVPAGTHTLTWSVTADDTAAIGPVQLYSVTLVPGTAEELLTARFPASEGWRWSDGMPPEPVWHLVEGVLTPAGVSLPFSGSWMERDITGPAEVNLGWYSDTPNWDQPDGGRFFVNGQDAGTTARNPYMPVTSRRDTSKGVSIPPGTHTFRWTRVLETGNTLTLGRCEVAPPVIAAEDAGLVVWVNHNDTEFRWRSVPGRTFTGETAMSARDTAHGECLVTGPGILSFMLAQDGRSIFTIRSENGDSWYFSSDPHDWHPVSVIIPPGAQRISFTESYCEPTDGTEIAWIDDMKFTRSGFAQWRAVRLVEPAWGTGWELTDSDGDGITDVIEYAFGTDPRRESAAAGPLCSMVDGRMRVQFPALPYSTTGLSYVVESSSDLQDWTQGAALPASAAPISGPSFTLPAAPRCYLRSRVLLE
jgi:hypothetical protein